jgi:hypothetical protein
MDTIKRGLSAVFAAAICTFLVAAFGGLMYLSYVLNHTFYCR